VSELVTYINDRAVEFVIYRVMEFVTYINDRGVNFVIIGVIKLGIYT